MSEKQIRKDINRLMKSLTDHERMLALDWLIRKTNLHPSKAEAIRQWWASRLVFRSRWRSLKEYIKKTLGNKNEN